METMFSGLQLRLIGKGNFIVDRSSTPFDRLYEESRNNRMKIEAARAHNAAVLRQQIFFFDPTQEMINNANGNLMSNPLLLGANNMVPGDLNPAVYAQQFQQQRVGGGVGSLHESSFVMSSNGSVNNGNSNVQFTQYQQQALQQQQLKSRLPIQPNTQQTIYTNLNGIPIAINNPASAVPPLTQNLNPTQMRVPQINGTLGNNNPNHVPNLSNVVNSKQEELLRQLFPSWF